MKTITSSIKTKLALSFSTLVLLASVGGVFSFILLSRANHSQAVKAQASDILTVLAEARKAEKDFLLYEWQHPSFLDSGYAPSLQLHAQQIQRLLTTLRHLENDSEIHRNDLSLQVNTLINSVNNYHTSFQSLVQALKRRGFKDHGLEGNMREYVHALQERESPEEKVFAFSLRRHEKDFVLRKDLSYVLKLHQTADNFMDYVKANQAAHMTDAYRARTLKEITAYVRQFDKIVGIEKQIGLTSDSGIRGDLKASAAEVQPMVDYLYEALSKRATQQQQYAQVVLSLGLFLVLGLGVFLSVFLTRGISRPIIVLDELTQQVVAGNFAVDERLKNIRTQDETGNLAQNFQRMLHTLQQQFEQIHIKNTQLEQAAQEDAHRNWVAQGVNELSDLLKGDTQNLQQWSFQLVSFVVRYTGSNQAALFLVDEQEDLPYMSLSACYAYGRRKNRKSQFGWGEGLVGECWRAQELIFLTDVPSHYMHIGSGLGDARPTCVVLVPLVYEGKVLGVLEMASFTVLAEHQCNFVQQVADKMALSLASFNSQWETQRLFEDSQKLTEDLKRQERDMQAQIEALQAEKEQNLRIVQEEKQEQEAKDIQLQVYSKLVSKVYSGVIITDNNLMVKYLNAQVMNRINSQEDKVLGKSVHYLFGASVQACIASLESDPHYQLNGFTQEISTQLNHPIGHKEDIVLSLSKIRIHEVSYYAFLFNWAGFADARKQVRKMLEVKGRMSSLDDMLEEAHITSHSNTAAKHLKV
ncbi:GAF domain-containing protein [Cytophagales bacterium LB-30]|uniref:histidine kinase n=1 Tax=Shiella aurantiaca TaxID=3058365 RepID=A0ABT8F1A4_9BACT|nr:GAF domain-containing protein [Shiella aurantiaca]MDN4164235.1 GAF domain-containing protein [Shiella aurantiaca]